MKNIYGLKDISCGRGLRLKAAFIMYTTREVGLGFFLGGEGVLKVFEGKSWGIVKFSEGRKGGAK